MEFAKNPDGSIQELIVDEPGDGPSVWRSPEISADEHQQLREMLLSPGWKVLAEKIWAHARKGLATNVQRATDDHRFHQGMYHGFREAEMLALRFAQEHEKVVEYRAPSETSLCPRARRTGY